jgi:hypothetical protein
MSKDQKTITIDDDKIIEIAKQITERDFLETEKFLIKKFPVIQSTMNTEFIEIYSRFKEGIIALETERLAIQTALLMNQLKLHLNNESLSDSKTI